MVDYGEAIKRPFSDVKKLLIGIAIQLIPIVNFMVIGYQLKCARYAMNKKYELPEWTEWKDLFINGLKVWIICIVYLLPGVIIGYMVLSGFIQQQDMFEAPGYTEVEEVVQARLSLLITKIMILYLWIGLLVPFAAGLFFGVTWLIYLLSLFAIVTIPVSLFIIMGTGFLGSIFIELIVALLLGLLASYLLPSALMSFMANESLGAAFRFGDILKKALRKWYLITWILMGLYTLIIGLILSIIPLIGSVVGGFFIGVTAMTAFGELYPEL